MHHRHIGGCAYGASSPKNRVPARMGAGTSASRFGRAPAVSTFAPVPSRASDVGTAPTPRRELPAARRAPRQGRFGITGTGNEKAAPSLGRLFGQHDAPLRECAAGVINPRPSVGGKGHVCPTVWSRASNVDTPLTSRRVSPPARGGHPDGAGFSARPGGQRKS